MANRNSAPATQRSTQMPVDIRLYRGTKLSDVTVPSRARSQPGYMRRIRSLAVPSRRLDRGTRREHHTRREHQRTPRRGERDSRIAADATRPGHPVAPPVADAHRTTTRPATFRAPQPE